MAHPTLTNQIGFDQVNNARNQDYAQSPNKETVAGMTKAGDVAPITRREDSIFKIDDHSTNKTPAKECATTETNPIIQPHSSTQFRIPVETDQQGVVVFHRGLVPYLKSGLSVTHANQYWSYYAHIIPGNNLSLFPAITAENIKDFLDRLNIIRQEVLSIGKATFEAEVVSAFNRSGHTNRGQPITCTKHVEELMRTWEGNVLSCLQLTWMNIHSLNTENSVFLKETLPLALVVHGATHDPPYTINNETNCKVFGKKRVSNHGLVKLANSACVNVKKRFQELEEKLFGMSVRTKARNRNSEPSDHYEIEINLEGSTKVRCKSYILARKTLFKDARFSDEIPPTEKDLRAYLNSGDEVKHLLQAAVSRAKRAGITREVLLSCMDECYQEVTSFSNIALPQDLVDSLECDSSTNDGCFQGRERDQQCITERGQMEQKHQTWHTSQARNPRKVEEFFLTQQLHPQEMVHHDIEKSNKPYEHKLQPSQMGRLHPHHSGVSTEDWSYTIDNCFRERRTVPQDIEPRWQMAQNLQALPYTHTGKPQPVQDHFLTQPHEPRDMVRFDSDIEHHQHKQHHPVELTEKQRQMHQRMMEQMSDRVRQLERQVQQQNAQQEQQGHQTVKGHGTSGDQLLEQPVQQDVTREQKQHQRPGIPMKREALLEFFEPSSQRLPPCTQVTTGDDYEDEESRSSQLEEITLNQMQEQHPVETILHSKFESSGQQKYLIRWIGDFKDSWEPKGNITSDIVDDFIKRKSKETANKHLAKV
jgi:hypothetical protein